MRPLIHEIVSSHSPESLVEQLQGEPGVVLLRSALFDSSQSRYSFVAARPFLTFRSFGPHCETEFAGGKPLPRSAEHRSSRTLTKTRGAILRAPNTVWQVQFGNPWHLLDSWMARYELLDEVDLPFPLGGCFGYWGYDLKNFVEPKLARLAVNDLELPDCHVGFYGSLVVFDPAMTNERKGSRNSGAACSRGIQPQTSACDPKRNLKVAATARKRALFPTLLALISSRRSSAPDVTSAQATSIRSTFRSACPLHVRFPVGNFFSGSPLFRPRRSPPASTAANFRSRRRRRNFFCA